MSTINITLTPGFHGWKISGEDLFDSYFSDNISAANYLFSLIAENSQAVVRVEGAK